MMTNTTADPRRATVARSAVARAARLLSFGLIGWVWFLSGDDSPWRAASLVAVLALAAVVGITWAVSRVLADRRWRAALDRYVELEQAKRTHPRRNLHARSQ